MLNFPLDTKHEPKCAVTYGTMGHLDAKQPPVKRKPFAAILNHRFVQKVELILPEEGYEIIEKDVLLAEDAKPAYSRMILPLKALLEGDFFNEYIKKGNVLMLSEGRAGIDNVYSLKEGILTLHLDKESYERAGIVGKPEGVKGKRGTKPRWIVELNLRLPAMLHGKKGFDRIVYAFKNVLTAPITWLFHDLGKDALIADHLDIHYPVRRTVAPQVSQDIKVNTPALKPPTDVNDSYGTDFEDYAVETLEWISLIQLDSPRIDPDDKIDSFLSRYVPRGESSTVCKLVKITWQGFLAPSWAHKIFVQVLLAIPRDVWFAYCVAGFVEESLDESRNCTILKVPDAPNEYILWDIM